MSQIHADVCFLTVLVWKGMLAPDTERILETGSRSSEDTVHRVQSQQTRTEAQCAKSGNADSSAVSKVRQR